jgi:hypothetical protein
MRQAPNIRSACKPNAINPGAIFGILLMSSALMSAMHKSAISPALSLNSLCILSYQGARPSFSQYNPEIGYALAGQQQAIIPLHAAKGDMVKTQG